MSENERFAADLRSRLTQLLAKGLSNDPAEHARQVAKIAGILSEAFGDHGFTVTLVGGSAIEVHAPGIYMSGDIDVVIDRTGTATADRDQVFATLGLERMGRHWRRGDLFIETVPGPVAGPAEEVEVGGAAFRVVRKEVPLRDRVVGFKHWRHTAYGDQAIAMLIAFGDDLDMEWLDPELAREDAQDALEALHKLARSNTPVTHERLLALIDDLHGQESDPAVLRPEGRDGVQ
ncbi:MAG: hypothetical protein HY704_01400 [Gemmatimonadetes bacterium]|nr:hypothetical protein [Gemmatimonadota bacterium]